MLLPPPTFRWAESLQMELSWASEGWSLARFAIEDTGGGARAGEALLPKTWGGGRGWHDSVPRMDNF